MSPPIIPSFLPLVPPSLSKASSSSDQSTSSSTTVSNKQPSSTLAAHESLSRINTQQRQRQQHPQYFPSAPASPTAPPRSSLRKSDRRQYRPHSLSSRFPLVLLNSSQPMVNRSSQSELLPDPVAALRPSAAVDIRRSVSSSSSLRTPYSPSLSSSPNTPSSNLSLNEVSPIYSNTKPPVKETNYVNIDVNPVSGRKLLNTYEIIKEIGRGQHGKVKLALNSESGELVVFQLTPLNKAIKIVDRNSKPRLGRRPGTTHEEKVRREIAIMKKCCHPNVVQLKEVLDDASSNKIYLVLEYLERGEIIWQNADGVPVMTIDQARDVARDVVSGLEYLHFQGIIHRDIKPANLLRDKDGTVKISDFGVSYASSLDWPNNDLELAKTAGTPAFFAPELCVSTTSDDQRPPRITHKIDIWAFGVTLYCMLFGKVPFIAEGELQLFNVIVNDPLVFPDEIAEQLTPSSSISSSENPLSPVLSLPDPQLELAKDLLLHLLEKDPVKRYDIMDIMQHAWMLQGMDETCQELFLTTTKEDAKIYVTNEEVQTAVLGMAGRIKRGLSRLGSHALHLTGLRRKNSSSSSQTSSRSSSRDFSNFRSKAISMPPQQHRKVPLTADNSNEISTGSSSSSLSSAMSSSSCHIPWRQHSMPAVMMASNSEPQPDYLNRPKIHSARVSSQVSPLNNEYGSIPIAQRQSESTAVSVQDESGKLEFLPVSCGISASSPSFNINRLLNSQEDPDSHPDTEPSSLNPLYVSSTSSERMLARPALISNSSSLDTASCDSSSSSSLSSSDDEGELTLTVGSGGNRPSAFAGRTSRLSDGNFARPSASSTSTTVVGTKRPAHPGATRLRSRSVTIGQVQHSREKSSSEFGIPREEKE